MTFVLLVYWDIFKCDLKMYKYFVWKKFIQIVFLIWINEVEKKQCQIQSLFRHFARNLLKNSIEKYYFLFRRCFYCLFLFIEKFYLYLPEGVKENPKSALNDHIGIAFKSSWALPATSFTNVPSHKRFQLFCVEKCHPGHETPTSWLAKEYPIRKDWSLSQSSHHLK